MGSTSNNGEDAATSQRLIELVDLDRIRRTNKKQKSPLKIRTRKEMCVLREKKESLRSKIISKILMFLFKESNYVCISHYISSSVIS